MSYATAISSDGLLSQTNKQRVKYKQPSFKINFQLGQAAQHKAEDMVKRDYWAHITPDGKAPWSFIEASGYSYKKAGENLAYGFNNSNSAVYGWMNSSTHRANILDRDFSEVGFGIANSADFVNSGPETVVVAFYGTPGKRVLNSSKSDKAINTTHLLSSEPASQKVPKVALFAQGSAPWAASAIGLIVGACLATLFIKHAVALRKTIKKGEKFVVHHPLLDVMFVAMIIFGIMLTRSAGLVR